MMRKTLAVLVLTFLVSFTLAYMSSNLVSAHQEDRGNLEAWIVLKAYDKNGKLLWADAHRDPLTLNFARWLELYFMSSSGTTSVTDVFGGGRTLATGSSYPPFYKHPAVKIQIGASSSSFGIDNYSLGSYVAEAESSSPTISVLGSEANVSISASFSFASETTINEVGVVVELSDHNNYGDPAPLLMARDVLPASRTVPAGGTLTVTWILRINQ